MIYDQRRNVPRQCRSPEGPAPEPTAARVHVLKTWPQQFRQVLDGSKTFEWRKADRPYAVSDLLLLLEFDPCAHCAGTGYAPGTVTYGSCCPAPHGEYSGREVRRRITMIQRDMFGIPEDYVILAMHLEEKIGI